MAEFVDYYSLLGVARDADPGAIRAAFRSAAQAWHADRWSAASEQHRAHAEEMMKRVNAAREILRDPVRRAEYDSSLQARGRAGHRSRPVSGAGNVKSRSQIAIGCPHCREQHELADPLGRWARLRCRRCGETFVALVGAVCAVAEGRAAGDGAQRLSVRARLADGSERQVSFVSPAVAALRPRDSFSIVYAENTPAAVYNHTRKSSSALVSRVATGPVRRDYLGLLAGVAAWLMALLLVRPAIGDALYVAAVLVATPLLAHRKRAPIGPWLAGAILTLGAAAFVLAARDPDHTRSGEGLGQVAAGPGGHVRGA